MTHHHIPEPEPCPEHPDAVLVRKVVSRSYSGQSDYPTNIVMGWRCSIRGCPNSR